MKVLITGGAGFIGSALVHALVGGGAHVTVLDDLSTGSMDNLHPAAGFRCLDVTSDAAAAAIAAAAPEVVMHLAAQVSVTASIADPAHDWHVNVDGTRLVAEAAAAAGVRRVLFASSAAVYGTPTALPLVEDGPTEPVVPYGRSKLEAERVLAEVLRPAGVDFACLRLANVYGPRQRADGEGGVVAEFASRMARGEAPSVYGSGRQTRDFVYVADVVEAFVEAARFEGELALPGSNGPAYNVSTGVETAVLSLAEGLRFPLRYSGEVSFAEARPGDVEASVLDPSKACRVFGWKAAVGLEAGLQATASWFAQRR